MGQMGVHWPFDPPSQAGAGDEDAEGVGPKDEVVGEAEAEEEVKDAADEVGQTLERAKMSWNSPNWRTATSTQCPTGTSQPSGLFCHVFCTNEVVRIPK